MNTFWYRLGWDNSWSEYKLGLDNSQSKYKLGWADIQRKYPLNITEQTLGLLQSAAQKNTHRRKHELQNISKHVQPLIHLRAKNKSNIAQNLRKSNGEWEGEAFHDRREPLRLAKVTAYHETQLKPTMLV
jgi:hypothetical protein